MTNEQLDGRNAPGTGPYDSVRDFLAALDARGRLLRIERMDQDAYEATGFAYRLMDKYGWDEAPAFLIEQIKIDGKWIDGPVLSNIYGGWDTEAMGLGVEEITDNFDHMYKAALNKAVSLADENGQWKRIKPTITDNANAPCKEVVITDRDLDMTIYPWLKCNPEDGGRYINMGSVILQDPELGRNVGTYRCQIKNKRKIAINTEVGRHGWTFLQEAKKRGQKSVKGAVVLGVDPITFALSCTKVTELGEDEFELAGGLKGKPIELVQCKTSDILVPADAEMVIEGEIPLDQQEEEGPHAEMFGYLGLKRDGRFFMNIEAITHRKNPLFFNVFTGVMRAYFTSIPEAFAYLTFKKLIPNLVGIHWPSRLTGVMVVSIEKKLAAEGFAAGQQVAAHTMFSKITIVVDKDVNIHNFREVMHAVATRWQPGAASLIIPRGQGSSLDPSAPERGLISKIIIDATRQLPEENGPKTYPPVSRQLLENAAPNVFDLVDSKWSEYWKHSQE